MPESPRRTTSSQIAANGRLSRLASLRSSNRATFFVFLSVITLWIGAVPMFGTPDEPPHMVRAAGLVRGQTGVRDEANRIFFEVPAIMDTHGGCYTFRPEQTADCLNIPPDDGEALVQTTAATYPPFFHLVIGAPTLIFSGLKSLYLMRLANGLVCAGLLTLAMANLRLLTRGGPVALGMAVSITPMVLFLSGPTNPSGIAATSGLAIWTAALVLLETESRRSIPRSCLALAVPFCILFLTRRDGLLWGGLIVVVLLVCMPWKRIMEILRHRAAWVWASIIGGTAGVQYFVWTGENAAGFSTGATASGGGSGRAAFRETFDYLNQAIGVLGWLDTHLPTIVYNSWWAAIAALIFGTVASGKPRHVVSVATSIFLLVGVTTYIGSVRHPYLQGRYYLPFAVGIPLLAGFAIAQGSARRPSKRAVRAGLGWLFLMHQLAFAQHLRRYAVGRSGTWLFPFDSAWQPTVAPIWVLMVGYFVASGAMMMMLADVATGRDVSTDRPQAEDTSS